MKYLTSAFCLAALLPIAASQFVGSYDPTANMLYQNEVTSNTLWRAIDANYTAVMNLINSNIVLPNSLPLATRLANIDYYVPFLKNDTRDLRDLWGAKFVSQGELNTRLYRAWTTAKSWGFTMFPTTMRNPSILTSQQRNVLDQLIDISSSLQAMMMLWGEMNAGVDIKYIKSVNSTLAALISNARQAIKWNNGYYMITIYPKYLREVVPNITYSNSNQNQFPIKQARLEFNSTLIKLDQLIKQKVNLTKSVVGLRNNPNFQ